MMATAVSANKKKFYFFLSSFVEISKNLIRYRSKSNFGPSK